MRKARVDIARNYWKWMRMWRCNAGIVLAPNAIESNAWKWMRMWRCNAGLKRRGERGSACLTGDAMRVMSADLPSSFKY